MKRTRSARQAVCASAMFIAVLGLSCDGAEPGKSTSSVQEGQLGAGVVVRVGAQEINEASLAYIAKAQGISVSEARELAVRDALFAAEAEARGFAAGSEFRAAQRGVLSRLLLRELYLEAARGQITEQELDEATARRWLEFDRPVGFRTVQAVVRFKKKDDAARRAKAAELAENIRRALVEEFGHEESKAPDSDQPGRSLPSDTAPMNATTEEHWIEQFRKTVNAVPAESFQVLVEQLPPVTADGRVIQPGGSSFAKEFAEAASKLTLRGELSPVVITEFGAHVMMLMERTPALTVERSERERLLRSDVIAARARALRKAIRDETLGEVSTSDASVDALLSLVPIGQ